MDHLTDSRPVLLGLSGNAETRAGGAFRQTATRNNSPRTPQDRPGHGTTHGTTPAPHWLDQTAVIANGRGFAAGFVHGCAWSVDQLADGRWRAFVRGTGIAKAVEHSGRSAALNGLARTQWWWGPAA